MLIQGQRIHLVLFEQQHLIAPEYLGWLQDSNVVRYIGRDELLEGVSFPQIEDYVKQLWANRNCWFLAIYHSESGVFIGTAKINFFNERGRRNGLADVGMMIGEKDFWGQGLATDVLRTLSRFAFNELGARKLSAGAMSLNGAMINAFLRVGFTKEGCLRQHSWVEGGFCDHVIIGCLRGELL